MAVRPLRYDGDLVLLQVAPPVESFDENLAALVLDMFETMYAAPGRGLAAPQVGVSRRVFVVDTDWKEGDPAPMIFINPEIVAQSSELVLGKEGCLSIPDKTFEVARPAWVELAWRDLDGAPLRGRFEAVQAVCVCHELDHLDGKMINQTGKLI